MYFNFSYRRGHAHQLAALFLAAVALLLAVVGLPAAPAAAAKAPAAAAARAGVLVVQNTGQFDAAVRFQLKQGGRTLWVTDDAVWLTSAELGAAIRFTFPGANPAAALEPFDRAVAQVSYLIGDDPAQWRQNVPAWSGVRYRELYPGVDLVIGDVQAADQQGAMPWRFEARAGAQVQGVSIRVQGADEMTTEAGLLTIQVQGKTLGVALPGWSVEGRSEKSASTATRAGKSAEFVLAPDAQRPFAAVTAAVASEPSAAGDLVFNANLGGSGTDEGLSIAVDYLGNAYVTGATKSQNFPMAGTPYDSSLNGPGTYDAFLAKYSPSGTLLYATYLGGTGNDYGNAVTVDGGLAYVAGETTSADFPGSAGSLGDADIFVAAFNLSGNALRFTRRIGGNDYDTASAIAVEGLETYITGMTYSTNLAGASCAQTLNRPDMIVARLTAAGVPVYTTCAGGDGLDSGHGIAVRNQTAYVTGETQSTDFPSGVLQGGSDMLVLTIGSGGAVTASARVGGDAEDSAGGIALGGDGSIYLAGMTSSTAGFPVSPGTYGGGASDGIVVKLQPSLTPVFAAYVGGIQDDWAQKIAVDTANAMFVAGTTYGAFPVSLDGYDQTANGGADFFLARLHLSSTAANKITYATYLGTANNDEGSGVATDTGGYGFITGGANASGPLGLPEYAYVAKVKMSNPPGTPSVSIGASNGNANLKWDAVDPAAYHYQVFLSSRPYFIPGDWSSRLPVSEVGVTSYSDSGALSQADVRFYVVKGVTENTTEVGGNSNRVGKFSFQLTKGG